MCGIIGFIGRNGIKSDVLERCLGKLFHRGPDDSGLWFNEDNTVSLGQSRLSIQDLSQAGHQPMHSNSGRYVMVYNGEIYNHLTIRSELHKSDKITWKGHSDTETLLAGFEKWGISETLNKAVGMFAIALWDEKLRQLSLIRDRFGEKPLYYGKQKIHLCLRPS